MTRRPAVKEPKAPAADTAPRGTKRWVVLAVGVAAIAVAAALAPSSLAPTAPTVASSSVPTPNAAARVADHWWLGDGVASRDGYFVCAAARPHLRAAAAVLQAAHNDTYVRSQFESGWMSKHLRIAVPASRVGDGIPDCCDGSDEGPSPSGSGNHQCHVRAMEARAASREDLTKYIRGAGTCALRSAAGRRQLQQLWGVTVKDREALDGATEQLRARYSALAGRLGELNTAVAAAAAAEDEAAAAPLIAEQRAVQQELMKLQQQHRTLQPLVMRVSQRVQMTAGGALGADGRFLQLAFAAEAFASNGPVPLTTEGGFAWDDAAAVCFNSVRRDKDFRGGSAEPDEAAQNVTFCPFRQATSVRVPLAAALPSQPGPESKKDNGSEDAKTNVDEPKAEVLGVFDRTAAWPISVLLGSDAVRGVAPGLVTTAPHGGAGGVPNATFARLSEMAAHTSRLGRDHTWPFPACGADAASTSWPAAAWGTEAALYRHGAACWGGPAERSIAVVHVCGATDGIVDWREDGKCIYEIAFQTPSACCVPAASPLALVHPNDEASLPGVIAASVAAEVARATGRKSKADAQPLATWLERLRLTESSVVSIERRRLEFLTAVTSQKKL